MVGAEVADAEIGVEVAVENGAIAHIGNMFLLVDEDGALDVRTFNRQTRKHVEGRNGLRSRVVLIMVDGWVSVTRSGCQCFGRQRL